MMKKLFLLLGLILPWIASAQIQFQSITFEEAINKAMEANKSVLVDVISGKTDDASINSVLRNKTLAQVIEQNFVTIRIDMAKEENAYFVPKVLGTDYPCVLFFSTQGQNIGVGYWKEMATNGKKADEVLSGALMKAETLRRSSCKIEFRDLSFPEALKLAQKEDKLVFVDCTMEGCEPCRNMEQRVFSQEVVADNYNRNFICIRCQRETDSYGVGAKYNVSAYPTYLFIDGSGNLVDSESGFLAVDKFQKLAGHAIDKKFGGSNDVIGIPATASTASIPATASTAALPASASNEASVVSEGASMPISGNTGTSMTAASEEQQESKIDFKKLTLEQAMAEAKAQSKLIYVDLSATWCGPCQRLKKVTFPNPMVADFMNQYFINIAFECDVDEISKEYRTKYKTSAFPSHLILDEKGELMHKFVGFLEPNDFVVELEKGTGKSKGLHYYNSKYLAGERSPEFMHEYIVTLANANEGGAAAKLAANYLNTLPLEQLAARKNFVLVNEFARDINDSVAQKVMNNQPLFKESVGENELNNYLYMLWSIKADSYVKEVNGKMVFDQKGYEEAMRQLKKSGFVAAESIALTSNVRNAQRLGDWKSFLDITTGYMKKEGAKASLMLTCNWGNDLKASCVDKEIWKKYGTAMMENYNQVKATNEMEAMQWEKSMEVLSKELLQ